MAKQRKILFDDLLLSVKEYVHLRWLELISIAVPLIIFSIKKKAWRIIASILHDQPKIFYCAFAILWGTLSILSLLKISGNSRNLNAGLAAFLPLMIAAIGRLLGFQPDRKYMVWLALIFSAVIIVDLRKQFFTLQEHESVRKIAVARISQKAMDREFFYRGNMYDIIVESGNKPVYESETLTHLYTNAGRDPSDFLRESLDNRKILLVLINNFEMHLFFSKYLGPFKAQSKASYDSLVDLKNCSRTVF